MPKPSRARGKPKKIHGVLDRLRSGVPHSKTKFPRDPPTIPHVLTVPIRVRCSFLARSHPTDSINTVQLPGEPTSGFNIIGKFNPARTGNYVFQWSLTNTQIFRAACMRVYGVDPTLPPYTQNFYNTDFAIQKVVCYGPDSRTNLPTTGIQLVVDFGPTVPGFAGRDSGGANTRAVTGATAPRLSWSNFGSPEIAIVTGVISPSNLIYQTGVASNAIDISLGCVDISLVVRRGAVNPSPIPTTQTCCEYIDSAGNTKSLEEFSKIFSTKASTSQ